MKYAGMAACRMHQTLTCMNLNAATHLQLPIAPFWHGENSVLFLSAAGCWLLMLEVGRDVPLVLLGLDSLWPRAGV